MGGIGCMVWLEGWKNGVLPRDFIYVKKENRLNNFIKICRKLTKTFWESIIYLAYLGNFIYELLFINQMFIYLLCSLNVSRTRMMLINSCDR